MKEPCISARLKSHPFIIHYRVLSAEVFQRSWQMFYDDLPIWGFIGKIEKILHPGDRTQFKYYLFTHIHFDILYNGNRVIEVHPRPST